VKIYPIAPSEVQSLGNPGYGRKEVIVTQWVRAVVAQVPPDQSLAGRSVVKSEDNPGNGSPKPDGSRMQALY